SEPVGARLETGLHKSEDGKYEHEEPTPSHEQIRTLSPNEQRNGGDECEKNGAAEHERQTQLIMRVRIENGEICRPNRLSEIEHKADDRVLESPGERDVGQRCNRDLLRPNGGESRDGSEGKKRKFFENQSRPI